MLWLQTHILTWFVVQKITKLFKWKKKKTFKIAENLFSILQDKQWVNTPNPEKTPEMNEQSGNERYQCGLVIQKNLSITKKVKKASE